MRIPISEFITLAEQRFGEDRLNWKFICPGCGHVASIRDYKDANAPEGAVGFSCIGRYLPTCRDWLGGTGPGPCNYTSGGLFCVTKLVLVTPDGKERPTFELAQ